MRQDNRTKIDRIDCQKKKEKVKKTVEIVERDPYMECDFGSRTDRKACGRLNV